jgi:hypothetical protein
MTYAIIAALVLVACFAIQAHKEIMRRQSEERLQHQLRTMEAAEKRQQELCVVMEAFLQHKGVPISLQVQQKRELRHYPGYFDKKLPTPQQEEIPSQL